MVVKLRRLFSFAVIMTSLVAVAVVPKSAWAATPAITRACDSVEYVNYLVNDGHPVDASTWPTATSMDDPRHWQLTTPPRYLVDAAQAGDVIVMKANAIVMPWNNVTGWWDDIYRKNSLGHGDGHIGIVAGAQYWEEYQGWMILIRSAGWSEDWGTYFDDAGCSNISESFVFVPNGADVTFWRASE